MALRWGLPNRSILFGPRSLGDDLLCTAVLREARMRDQPFAMFTARPELFQGNHDPAKLLPIDDYYIAMLQRLDKAPIRPYYVGADSTNPLRDILPSRHIIAEMCSLAGISGSVSLRPYLRLAPRELAVAPQSKIQIAVHSTGLGAAIPYPTKEWGPEQFDAMTSELSSEFTLVQLGSVQDPLLSGVTLDLRGKTNLREAAAVLANSRCFIGLEGFLTHLARAVDTPAVVIHGGRAPEGLFSYLANENIYTKLSCSPCGLRDGCPHDMTCMREITPETVLSSVRKLLDRSSAPLPVETAAV